MPDVPSGTVTVTLVSSGQPTEGVKVAVLPLIFQDPAVSGEILGSGVLADSGAEKPTVMGLVPLTVPAPERGVNEATSIAGAGVTGFGVALAPDGPLCRDAATDVVRTVV
jgi:hypothetical protein